MRERAGIAMATLLIALGLYNGVNVLTDHLASPAFPAHARFHAALGGVYMVLLSILAGVMTWWPTLRWVVRGLPLAFVLLAVPLGFLAAVAIVPAGSPGVSYEVQGIAGAALALVASWLMASGGSATPRQTGSESSHDSMSTRSAPSRSLPGHDSTSDE